MIYVTGADGQLGMELRGKLRDAHFLTRNDLDLSNVEMLKTFLSRSPISMLINCAAYTKVDKAEEERGLAETINTVTPALIAKYSKEKKFKFIHFSTDYVFNGLQVEPYKETTPTQPINYYGLTKEQGEKKILQENEDSLIIRTSWVYAKTGKNFINTILKTGVERDNLNVVYDQIGTLTWASDLADVVLKASDLSGIYHFTNEGVSSWYDVAVELKRLKKFKANVVPILSEQYPTPAKRPHYSVLDKQKIKSALNIKIPHWTESLELCLKQLS